jgi:hypothetical protein
MGYILLNAVYRRNLAVALDYAVAKAQVYDVWVNCSGKKVRLL